MTDKICFDFACPACGYKLKVGDNNTNIGLKAGISALWTSINSSKELVTDVRFPQCSIHLIQCCHRKKNINPNDPDVIAQLKKQRRTATGLLKHHVRQHKHVKKDNSPKMMPLSSILIPRPHNMVHLIVIQSHLPH